MTKLSCKPRSFVSLLVVMLVFISMSGPTSGADNEKSAQRLLEITQASKWFELAATTQGAEVIEAYKSIISTSTDMTLPDSIIQQIRLCYRQHYSWENFETGFIKIFAENLNQQELQMLIDFFSDKSVPPPQIDQFKELRDKATDIELGVIEFMSGQIAGCDEQNVELILHFLSDHGVNRDTVVDF